MRLPFCRPWARLPFLRKRWNGGTVLSHGRIGQHESLAGSAQKSSKSRTSAPCAR